jgi:hypothetical protein
MLKTLGIVFFTLGSLILSISVLRHSLQRYVNFKWSELPWEIRLFCRIIFGAKNQHNYFMKVFGADTDRLPLPDDFSCKERLLNDFPIIAVVLIIIGFILSII